MDRMARWGSWSWGAQGRTQEQSSLPAFPPAPEVTLMDINLAMERPSVWCSVWRPANCFVEETPKYCSPSESMQVLNEGLSTSYGMKAIILLHMALSSLFLFGCM